MFKKMTGKFVKVSISLAFILSGHLAFAQYTHPELNNFKVLAQKALDASQFAAEPEEIADLKTQNDNLIAMGTQIMDLFAQAMPACADQYTAFKVALPQAAAMTTNQAHDVFHDAIGLPTAPKYCYFGRSTVVYPLLNNILLNDLTYDNRIIIVDHYHEVIEHLDKVEQYLNNPPK